MARQIYGNDQVLSHADYVPLGVEGCREKAFVSGHFGFAFARPLMEGRYCFTFLRDPHQRLLSLYRYCRSRPDVEGVLYDAASKYGFVDFLKTALDSDCRSHVWNNQVWQLAYGFGADQVSRDVSDFSEFSADHLLEKALANSEAFDHVGLVETFDADAKLIFRKLGRLWIKVKKANVSRNPKPVLDLGSEAHDMLEEITILDRRLYDHILSRRQASTLNGSSSDDLATRFSGVMSKFGRKI